MFDVDEWVSITFYFRPREVDVMVALSQKKKTKEDVMVACDKFI